MKILPLRRTTPSAQRRAQFIRGMTEERHSPRCSLPPPSAVLEKFVSEDGIIVLVDLRGWCEIMLPDVSGLTLEYLQPERMRDFLHYSRPESVLRLPNGMNVPLTQHTPFQEGDLLPDMLPEVDTTLGQGWLMEFPQHRLELRAVDVGYSPVHLTFRLELCLGFSWLSSGRLALFRTGDVLLINALTEQILCSGMPLGKFSHDKEVFMTDSIYNFEDEALTDYFGSEIQTNNDNEPVSGINRVPVRLDFIIHQQTLTLEELRALTPGSVLGTGSAGENSILIRANGALIARGELVWVNEQLSVEIQTLYNEASDGK